MNKTIILLMPIKFLFLYTLCFSFLSLVSQTTKASNDPNIIYVECTNDITHNSVVYNSNLIALLSALASNASKTTGFSNFTIGSDPPDAAYGLFLCRGDISAAVCQNCVSFASRNVLQQCPKNKRAAIWYDECMLRYSNHSIFSFLDQSSPGTFSNREKVTEASPFRQVLGEVMDDIATRASSSGQPGKKFATREKNFSSLDSLQTLYGLGQCTPDLSPSDCDTCLRRCISIFSTCCDLRAGGRVLLPSCTVRYEMYQFYNVTAADPPSLLPPPPPPTTSRPDNVTAPPPPRAPPPRPDSSPGRKVKTVAIGTSVSGFLVVALLGSYIYYQRIRKKTNKEDEGNISEVDLLDWAGGRIGIESTSENLQGDMHTKSQDFTSIQLDIIHAATRHFSQENKLGEGGFGPVYKGTLPDGKEIAVKRLSKTSGQGLLELKNEVTMIARLQHRNLVRLLGCCLEGNESLLIYEYMPNRSLDVFLFDSTKGAELDWKRRLLIINGIARGLLYLHEDSRLRIIHRDLKASNILLDHEMNPKISDFGMARIFGGNQSEANTNKVVGTYGYMAPEYAMEGLFSIKSDVYSFGVLLLEIISGKKNGGFYLSEHGQSLLTFAWKLWCQGQGLELIDPLLDQSFVATEVHKCIHIGLLCVQEDHAIRPTMSSVVVMLASDTMTRAQPTQPAFAIGRLALRPAQSLPNVNLLSTNEVTLSKVSPR